MANLRAWISPRFPPITAVLAVSLMVLWAYHDGGYDADTWYWGALVTLSLLLVAVMTSRRDQVVDSRPLRLALAALTMYVIWSYLSIAWAGSPGDALQGSNRALLYLLAFALFAALPWSPESVLLCLVLLVVGISLIAASVLVRLLGPHATGMFTEGRLVTPTGYFNASAALFTITALVGLVIAARRELPALLRGFMLASCCGCLQLALLCQSRGWLFTLPLVLVTGLILVRERLRIAAWALLPAAGVLVLLPRLLRLFHDLSSIRPSARALPAAGTGGLAVCGAILIMGTLGAITENRLNPAPLSARRRRVVGTAALAATVSIVLAGGLAATHNHPGRYLSRQWAGFTGLHYSGESSSHFSQVGSGRYDFWRVSLKAFAANPFGGLGQDNFADYYIRRRRTEEEPQWTHSLEMRLLAHTGLVGTVLFLAFLVAATSAAVRARRRPGLAGAAAAAAGLPAVVWLIHGSVDWFWEIPALTVPALSCLAMAAALDPVRTPVRRMVPGRALAFGGGAILVGALIALGFPYLSVTETSQASRVAPRNPAAALHDLDQAAQLNPLSALPARVGGAIALRGGLYMEAAQRFRQAIHREPGGWFSWLGAGLAASALGNADQAHEDYTRAHAINPQQPAVRQALARVDTTRPLTASQAFALLVLVT